MLKNLTIKDLIYPALFASLISILGFISIPLPFVPVPLTGQSLGIMLAASILSIRQTFLSILTFLFLGIIGIPVFAGGSSGIGVILSNRGGYLIGFLVGGILISYIKEKFSGFLWLILSNILGGIVILYLLGVTWLSFVTKLTLYKAFLIGGLTFLPGDLIKACIASFIAIHIKSRIRVY